MFPISIKIVVEEDAVDFGLHLTVPDKRPPSNTHTLTHNPTPQSLPILLMTKGPRPDAQMEKEKEREGEAMGVEKRRGRRLSESERQSYKRPFMYSYP